MNDTEVLGQRLREAREAKELTLEEAERSTRIRAKFLEALEQGDYTIMSTVQVQGFLRNYARFLGLDLDLLLEELESDKGRGRRRRRTQELPAAPVETPAAPKPTRQRRQRGWFGSLVILLLAGGIVVGLVIGATVLINHLAETGPSSPSIVETLPVSPTGGPAGDGAAPQTPLATLPQTPDLAYTPPALTGTGITITITMIESTWLRVMVDGQVAQQGWARPGDVWHFQGNSSVGIRASNAAALVLIVNNQPQGVLGTRGQLFDQTFTLGGAATPTVGPTSTATTTLLPTWTLTATASRTPTSTASASAASPDQATLLFTGIPPGAETATSAPAIQIPPTETLTQTASATSTLTPSPTATLSPTSTLTPSATPFLPPRLTRTPSPAPK